MKRWFGMSFVIVLMAIVISGAHSEESWAGEWEWVPVTGSLSGNGQQPTGFGINKSTSSVNANKLIIFFMGGGACWDYETCNGLTKQARNIDIAYNEQVFREEIDEHLVDGTVNFVNTANQFDGYNIVWIPYCTGDMFRGNRYNSETGKYHVGYTNYGLFLQVIKQEFYGKIDEIIIFGASAGGFGAYWNFERTKVAFNNIPATLISDSGPPMDHPYFDQDLQDKFEAAWWLEDADDDDEDEPCDDCRNEYDLLHYLAAKYPEDNFGFISYTEDVLIRYYFGFGIRFQVFLPIDMFQEGLLQVYESLAPYDNARVYYTDGRGHVLIRDDSVIEVNDVSLSSWLNDMVTHSPGWTDVMPF